MDDLGHRHGARQIDREDKGSTGHSLVSVTDRGDSTGEISRRGLPSLAEATQISMPVPVYEREERCRLERARRLRRSWTGHSQDEKADKHTC
jgi:hypothetical protein